MGAEKSIGLVTRCLLVSFLLAWLASLTVASPALGLSIYDYFTIEYATVFSDDQIEDDEVFYATVTGEATCKQDLPLPVSSGYIRYRVIAEHLDSGERTVLEPDYRLDIEPFPNHAGESATESTDVALRFPSDCQPGSYEIMGELIESRAVVSTSTTTFSVPVSKYLPQSQEMGMVTYTSGEIEEETITGPEIALSDYTDPAGIMVNDLVIQSTDSLCKLGINRDTLCLNIGGAPLGQIGIAPMEEGPAPPAGYSIAGLFYELGPDGASFQPAITITMSYEESSLPVQNAEDSLVVSWWNETEDNWVLIEESEVDTISNTVAAPLSHFTFFTILQPSSSAETGNTGLEISDMLITPREAKTGEEVTISVLVANKGEDDGTYTVAMEINGIVEATAYIPLYADSSTRVSFTSTKDEPGIYSVDISGLTGTFEVVGASVTEPPEDTAPAEAPPETSQPPASPPIQTSPLILAGIITGVACGIAIPLTLRRRRKNLKSD